MKPHYRDRPVNASVCELSVMGADYFAFCLPCCVCSVGDALVLSSGVFCVVVNLVAIFLESSWNLFCTELGEFATAEPCYHKAWEAIRFSGLLIN